MIKGIVFLEDRFYDQEPLRYNWLDTIRGIIVISMMAYHAMWDVVNILGVSIPWYDDTIGYVWQQSICWGFIIISGMSYNLGCSYIKRGTIVFVCGIVISVVTFFVVPEAFIIFGILTFLGAAMLVMIPLRLLIDFIPPMIGTIISIILFVVLRNINTGYLGFETLSFYNVPEFFYSNNITTFLGFPFKGFMSADYFSFFPWFFLFLAGYNFGRILFSHQIALGKDSPISFLGRHALWAYMLHQPVIYLIVVAVGRM